MSTPASTAIGSRGLHAYWFRHVLCLHVGDPNDDGAQEIDLDPDEWAALVDFVAAHHAATGHPDAAPERHTHRPDDASTIPPSRPA